MRLFREQGQSNLPRKSTLKKKKSDRGGRIPLPFRFKSVLFLSPSPRFYSPSPPLVSSPCRLASVLFHLQSNQFLPDSSPIISLSPPFCSIYRSYPFCSSPDLFPSPLLSLQFRLISPRFYSISSPVESDPDHLVSSPFLLLSARFRIVSSRLLSLSARFRSLSPPLRSCPFPLASAQLFSLSPRFDSISSHHRSVPSPLRSSPSHLAYIPLLSPPFLLQSRPFPFFSNPVISFPRRLRSGHFRLKTCRFLF